MNKPLFGLLLGGFLGIFDGLSALVSAPETRTQILGIVIGSTIMQGKYYLEIMLPGCILGLVVGYATQRYAGRRGAPSLST